MFWLLNKLILISWVFSLIVVCLTAFALFNISQFVRSESSTPIPANVRTAADELCGRLLEALPNPEIALRPTLVLPFVGDRESLIFDALEQSLSSDGRYRPVDAGLLEQLFERIGLDQQPVSDPDQAIRLARAADAEVVVFGNVRRMVIDDGAVDLQVDVNVVQSTDDQTIYRGTLNNHPQESNESIVSPKLGSFFVLSLFVLAWPVALIPVSRAILKAENNGLTAAALLVMIGIPVAVWWSLIFSTTSGLFAMVLLVVGVAGTAVWCVFVTNSVADQV